MQFCKHLYHTERLLLHLHYDLHSLNHVKFYQNLFFNVVFKIILYVSHYVILIFYCKFKSEFHGFPIWIKVFVCFLFYVSLNQSVNILYICHYAMLMTIVVCYVFVRLFFLIIPLCIYCIRIIFTS